MLTPADAAISAAPGVDHASTTGILTHPLSVAEPMALTRQMENIQLAVCAGVAPNAAANSSAMVEPYPTNAAASAAEINESRMRFPRVRIPRLREP